MTKEELRQWIINNASGILAGYPEVINQIELNIQQTIASHEAGMFKGETFEELCKYFYLMGGGDGIAEALGGNKHDFKFRFNQFRDLPAPFQEGGNK